MSISCEHVTHRAIEGVLTYLNAFLILDFARIQFKDNPGLAVAITIVVTLIIFYFLHRHCMNSPCASHFGTTASANEELPKVLTMIPPIPSNPAEAFRPRRNMSAF